VPQPIVGRGSWNTGLRAILNQTPTPVRQLNPRITVELETIINKALEKDRAKRYHTAAEIAAALENLTREIPPKRRVIPWLGAAVGAVILSAVAVSVWIAKRQPHPQPTTELKLTQLTFNSSQNPVVGGTISPDGKYLAYSDPEKFGCGGWICTTNLWVMRPTINGI
jgi:hypothetical protein